MDRKNFAITAEGQVYRQDGPSWELLGHIASILREETALGREASIWWQARLAAEDPGENIVVIGRSKPFFTNSRENGLSVSRRLTGTPTHEVLYRKQGEMLCQNT